MWDWPARGTRAHEHQSGFEKFFHDCLADEYSRPWDLSTVPKLSELHVDNHAPRIAKQIAFMILRVGSD